jgi:hypothetical protein
MRRMRVPRLMRDAGDRALRVLEDVSADLEDVVWESVPRALHIASSR